MRGLSDDDGRHVGRDRFRRALFGPPDLQLDRQRAVKGLVIATLTMAGLPAFLIALFSLSGGEPLLGLALGIFALVVALGFWIPAGLISLIPWWCLHRRGLRGWLSSAGLGAALGLLIGGTFVFLRSLAVSVPFTAAAGAALGLLPLYVIWGGAAGLITWKISYRRAPAEQSS